MSEGEKPSIAEMRAHARAIDEGLEQHQRQRRLWLVTKTYRFFVRDTVMAPQLVLALNASEARQLVREKFYRQGRDVPDNLRATALELSESRVLDVYDEQVRAGAEEESYA